MSYQIVCYILPYVTIRMDVPKAKLLVHILDMAELIIFWNVEHVSKTRLIVAK